jgi:hypothetical protein
MSGGRGGGAPGYGDRGRGRWRVVRVARKVIYRETRFELVQVEKEKRVEKTATCRQKKA